MIRRREFMTVLAGATAWPLAARAQQPALPVVAFINGGTANNITASRNAAAFSRGLDQTGFIEGQNVRTEFYWLEGHYDRLPALLTDLVRRRVALITTPGSTPASLAAKAATTSIPIVFGVPENAVQLGLVARV